MKKILISIFIFVSTFLFINISNAGSCSYTEGGNVGSIKQDLESCLSDTKVLNSNMSIENGTKTLVVKLVKNISIILSIAAIGFIAYGAMLLVLSGGNDEKIKKGKEVIKWSILGFIALLSASGLITLIVNIIYGISK